MKVIAFALFVLVVVGTVVALDVQTEIERRRIRDNQRILRALHNTKDTNDNADQRN
jgi:hypothetical protein